MAWPWGLSFSSLQLTVGLCNAQTLRSVQHKRHKSLHDLALDNCSFFIIEFQSLVGYGRIKDGRQITMLGGCVWFGLILNEPHFNPLLSRAQCI